MLGGLGSLPGALLGSALLVFLPPFVTDLGADCGPRRHRGRPAGAVGLRRRPDRGDDLRPGRLRRHRPPPLAHLPGEAAHGGGPRLERGVRTTRSIRRAAPPPPIRLPGTDARAAPEENCCPDPPDVSCPSWPQQPSSPPSPPAVAATTTTVAAVAAARTRPPTSASPRTRSRSAPHFPLTGVAAPGLQRDPDRRAGVLRLRQRERRRLRPRRSSTSSRTTPTTRPTPARSSTSWCSRTRSSRSSAGSARRPTAPSSTSSTARACPTCSSPPARCCGATTRRPTPTPSAGSPTTRARGRSSASTSPRTCPDAKVGLFLQDDDFGEDGEAGVRQYLDETRSSRRSATPRATPTWPRRSPRCRPPAPTSSSASTRPATPR